MMFREETRRQRYEIKKPKAKTLPFYLAAVNFGLDENLALLVRAASCYGASGVFVIGDVPPRSFLRPKSGTTTDFVNIKSFSNPSLFLAHCRENKFKIVSAEICDGAKSLFQYRFDISRPNVIVVGNETTGVPGEVILNSDNVYIEMPGIGAFLNTAQAGTVFANEFVRQWSLSF
jgi:tRNA G18 (ribose-2'-O)-methylase SpoU